MDKPISSIYIYIDVCTGNNKGLLSIQRWFDAGLGSSSRRSTSTSWSIRWLAPWLRQWYGGGKLWHGPPSHLSLISAQAGTTGQCLEAHFNSLFHLLLKTEPLKALPKLLYIYICIRLIFNMDAPAKPISSI